jgi:hypothetical protein
MIYQRLKIDDMDLGFAAVAGYSYCKPPEQMQHSKQRTTEMRPFDLPNRNVVACICAAVLLAVLAAVSAAADRPKKALVIGLSGPCEALPGQTPLKIGSELDLGQKVFFPYPRKSTYYVDILMPNGQVDTFECTGWLTCLASHQVPSWTGDDERVPGMLDALKNVALPNNEQDYVNANVRGESGTDEMVLRSVDGRVDVSPLILDAPEGTYSLSFAPRPQSTVIPNSRVRPASSIGFWSRTRPPTAAHSSPWPARRR